MSQQLQSQGILKCRNELDDQYWSKGVFRFSPMQGAQDGINTVFQIPQQRIVVFNAATWAKSGSVGNYNLFPQIYKNNVPMVFNTDYILSDYLNGIITYQNNTQPIASDSIDVSFNYLWMTDVDLDNHLDHAAAEIGYVAYYTQPDDLTDPNITPQPIGSTLPTDIPDALFSAIIMLGAAFAARALSLRFSVKYDTSAGDQSWSPSQMAKSFSDLAGTLEKQGYTARDDYYKGQSRQYQPAVNAQIGYVLPNVTPPR